MPNLSSYLQTTLSLGLLLALSITAFSQELPPSPKTARDIAMMRAYYDKTVWQQEVLAQKHERYFTKLWDQLIKPTDKYEALQTAKFQKLLVGKNSKHELLDWDIKRTKFEGTQPIPYKNWSKLLASFKRLGFEITDTEWHHSEFTPSTENQSAKSVISASIYGTHSKSDLRFVIKGDLHIEWQPQPKNLDAKYVPEPKIIDATRIKILSRKGDGAFALRNVETFQTDGTGKQAPVTTHPIILQDLNGDHLPEVSVVGGNTVFWNKGNWKFDKAKLVEVPTRHTNAAAFADFTGDGVLDLVCAAKNGLPELHAGEAKGPSERNTFAAPRKLTFTEERLRNPVGLAVGDVDADGDLDIFLGQNKVGYQTGDIPTPYYDANDSFPSYLLINDGKGNFSDGTEQTGLSAKRQRRNFSASLVDFDADNDLDLLLTNDFQGNDLYLNDGNGKFTDASKSLAPASVGHGMSHSFGDYNLDGRLDFVFIAMSSTTARRLDKLQLGPSKFQKENDARSQMGYGNRLYLNTEDGFKQAAFNADVARTGWSWGSTTLDFDRDGDQDIYIANGQTSGTTTKDYCTRYWCHDLYHPAQQLPKPALKEFFQGMAPLFSGSSVSWNGFEHNALLMNVDGEGFVNVGHLMNCGSVLDSRATVAGDIDLDGKVDLLFEHFETRTAQAHLHFLKNQWQDDHHWIGFHLPSSAYGTKVNVTLDNGRVLTQHYVAGHSVWTQHPNSIHFGLGKNLKPTKVEITWPNGKSTTLKTPTTDRYHVVVSP